MYFYILYRHIVHIFEISIQMFTIYVEMIIVILVNSYSFQLRYTMVYLIISYYILYSIVFNVPTYTFIRMLQRTSK